MVILTQKQASPRLEIVQRDLSSSLKTREVSGVLYTIRKLSTWTADKTIPVALTL